METLDVEKSGAESLFVGTATEKPPIWKKLLDQVQRKKKYIFSVSAMFLFLFIVFLSSSGESICQSEASNSSSSEDADTYFEKCRIERSQPIINFDERTRPKASPDLRALVTAYGFVQFTDDEEIPNTGYLPLEYLRNVTFISSNDASSPAKENAAQLILDFDCVRITFNIIQKDEYETYYDGSGYSRREQHRVSKTLMILKSFRVDLKRVRYNLKSGQRTTNLTKVTKFSPAKHGFEKTKRFSCLQPMTLDGKSLRLDVDRGKVYEKSVAEVVFSRLEIELEGDSEYTEKRFFSKEGDITSCKEI